jgi:hypothetical protein
MHEPLAPTIRTTFVTLPTQALTTCALASVGIVNTASTPATIDHFFMRLNGPGLNL